MGDRASFIKMVGAINLTLKVIMIIDLLFITAIVAVLLGKIYAVNNTTNKIYSLLNDKVEIIYEKPQIIQQKE